MSNHSSMASSYPIMPSCMFIFIYMTYLTTSQHLCINACSCHYQSIDPNHLSNNPRTWKILKVDWKKGAWLLSRIEDCHVIAKQDKWWRPWYCNKIFSFFFLHENIIKKGYQLYIDLQQLHLSPPNHTSQYHTSYWVIKTVIWSIQLLRKDFEQRIWTKPVLSR